MNRKKLNNIYIWVIISSMATFFTFAMNKDAMNYILIGIMSLIPVFLFLKFPNFKKSEFLIYTLFGSLLLSALLHFSTFRISTILYSLMFILTFIFYLRLIKYTPLKIESYQKIIKYLLWAFFIVMIIQQFCALLGIPIINYRVGDLSTFKVNSLASEPSYFSKIVTVLMLSYISIKEIKMGRNYILFFDFKSDALIWFLFLYQILFCGSSFAFVLLFFFLLKYIKLKPKTIFISLFSSLIIIVLLVNLDLVVVERITKIGKAFLSLDEVKIFEADSSGAFRIVPSILYVKQFNILNPNLWLGCGVDYTRSLMPTLMPALEENSFNVGLFPSFIWDFGIISTILLLLVVFKFAIEKKSVFDFLIWFIIILDAPFNTQLFWITLILMSSNKLLRKIHFRESTKPLLA